MSNWLLSKVLLSNLPTQHSLINKIAKLVIFQQKTVKNGKKTRDIPKGRNMPQKPTLPYCSVKNFDLETIRAKHEKT